MKAIEVGSSLELHQSDTLPVSINTAGRQSREEHRHVQPTEYGWEPRKREDGKERKSM